MKRVLLSLFMLMSIGPESFGMLKSEVLEHLKDCVKVSEQLESLIQNDEVLTLKDWDSFNQRVEAVLEKTSKKIKTNTNNSSDALGSIFGEYYFQLGLHYQDVCSKNYNLKKAITFYMKSAGYNNYEGRNKFIILGLSSEDKEIRTKALKHGQKFISETRQNPSYRDATVLNILGAYFEVVLKDTPSACDCYEKAVNILKTEDDGDIKLLNAWKNLERLKEQYVSDEIYQKT